MPETNQLSALWSNLRTALFVPKTPLHVQKSLVELFSEESRVIYLPTGQIYQGKHEITALLKSIAIGQVSVVHQVIEEEKYPLELLSSVSGFDKVQRLPCSKELCVLTLVHDNDVSWLLPEVKPTKKRVVIVLSIDTTFNDQGDIQQLLITWDQASVMKQIGLLPTTLFCKNNSSETTLPVVGSKIADPLRSTPTAEVVKTPEVNKPKHSHIDFDPVPTPDLVRPSTRVFHKPGGPTHDIFSTKPEPVKTSIPIDPRRYETKVDLGSTPVNQKVAVKVLPELISHLNSMGVAEEEKKPHPQRKQLPDPALARQQVDSEEVGFRPGKRMIPGKELEEHEPSEPHSGVRLVGSATYNVSHFVIGGDEPVEEEAPASFKRKQQQRDLYKETESPLASKTERTNRSNESQWSLAGPSQPVGSDIHRNSRPSSRVLNPPGGKTSWSLA